MSDEAGERAPTPAERRVEEYLRSVGSHPPAPDPSLAPAVLRAARWQRAVRAPLRVVAMIATAGGQGVRILIGGGRPR